MDSQLPRILDANANRAREGLRTAEDYVRFIVGDLHGAERLRMLRQGITDTLLTVPELERALIESRNVSSDPLQPDNWKDVLRRLDVELPLNVAHRGLKRAQEAFRVLEEYLRGSHNQQAERISKLRYSAYEEEQRLVCTSAAMQILHASRVYVLLTAAFCKNNDVVKTAQFVLNAGVKVIQLREKQTSDAEILALMNKLSALCAAHGAIFFSNDRVDLAILAKSSGVHLGQTDIMPRDARRLAGGRLIVGRSTHSAEQARHAVEIDKADYIGIGSMFETQSKDKLILAGLKLAEEVAALDLHVPVFAIGGITADRLPALKKAGVTRVAVSHAIIGSASPESEARRFVELMAA